MGIIKITANNLELDIVSDTLNILRENNAFITDFKVAHSSFPFLIVENEKTVRALGPRDITSVLKKKIVPVVVYEMGERFNGQLQILSNINGFRKCNIKYGVEPLDILDKKLIDLLPVISVTGTSNPVPYTEESLQVIFGASFWDTYPLQFVGKIYPEAKFQFPQMAWKTKFNEDAPEADDPWFLYKGYYNFYEPTGNFSINNYTITGPLNDNISVFNRNIPSPQLFLLAVLEYAFATIGWKIAGDFVSNSFIKRLLILSTENNLCKVVIAPSSQTFHFTDLVLRSSPGEAGYDYYVYDLHPTSPGTYTFQYDITEALRSGGVTNTPLTQLVWQLDAENIFTDNQTVYSNYNDPAKLSFKGSFEISVSEEQVGTLMRVMWLQLKSKPFIAPAYNLQWTKDGKEYYMMHPTIQLGRYAPEETLSDYINNVKNTFALDLKFDSVAKVANFNFTANSLIRADQHLVQRSMANDEFDPPENIAFIMKYANDEDTALYVDNTGITLNKKSTDEFVDTIESKFKIVPRGGTTADLTTIEDKDGTGLMIYAPAGTGGFELPVITDNYNGFTLEWDGALGLYNTYHKNSVRFRLNASLLEIEGPFTEIEIAKIAKVFKIHINHQTFVVMSMEYEPTRQDNYIVKLSLESVNF